MSQLRTMLMLMGCAIRCIRIHKSIGTREDIGTPKELTVNMETAQAEQCIFVRNVVGFSVIIQSTGMITVSYDTLRI